MQQPDLSPAYTPSAPPPLALADEVAEPRPQRTRMTTLRPTGNGADAVMFLATTVLVVSAAFLESASDAAGAWLVLAGLATTAVLVARRFRSSGVSSAVAVSSRRKL
jgi:hypothetical protein